MSRLHDDNLTGEKIKQLLSAAGAESVEDARQNVEALEYDWRSPRYFSREQLTKLNHFAEKIAQAASKEFTRFFQTDFQVTTDSTSQHFANEFIRQHSDNENPEFFLLFGPPPKQASANAQPSGLVPWGLVGIPHKTAIAWTTQSLGRTGSDEHPGRNLSQLESSLLLDAAGLFVQALSNSCDDQSFRTIGNIVSGRFPFDVEDTKELCEISFNTKRAGSQNDPVRAFLLMPCEKLEPAAKISTQAAKTLSPEAASKAMMEHLQQIPILVAAELGSASVAFGQLMSLAVNDVLILDTKVSEPVKLTVNKMDFFHGRAAKSAGKYAVAITHLAPRGARAGKQEPT